MLEKIVHLLLSDIIVMNSYYSTLLSNFRRFAITCNHPGLLSLYVYKCSSESLYPLVCRWYELSCLVLQDPQHRIDLQTFSQPSPIPAEYILKAQDRTPKDYPLRWSGLAVTIGQIVEEECPYIGHVDWQGGIVGVSRRESLFLAAKSLAYMYRQRLPTTFVS